MFGRLFKIAFLISVIYLVYLTIYPNDFFLSQKLFKKNLTYHFEKSFNRLIIYDKNKITPTLIHFIDHPEEYLKEKISYIKNNNKRTIVKLNIDDKNIIIKKYNFKSWYDWITKCPFRSSKAYRYWYYAHQFKDKGILTVNPIAIIEKRIGLLWTHTYLIMECSEGYMLNELKDQGVLDKQSSSRITEQLQNTLDKFNESNWIHPDFKDKNVLITDQTIAVLDLDEIHTYAFNNYFYKRKFAKKHKVTCP